MKDAGGGGCEAAEAEPRHQRPWLPRTGRFVSTRTIVSINIFVLLVNTYVLIMQLSQSGRLRAEDYFYSPVSEQQEVQMRSVLKVFHEAMRAANVTYFLCAGALLGSVRHHGRIPWDDDIDVMVPLGQLHRMEAALRRLQPEYQLYKFMEWPAAGKWKFFRSDAEPFLLQPWSRFRWPYVDIFFVQEHNSTHLEHAYYPGLWFARSEIFPLQLRPYEGMLLPTPCNHTAFLRSEFQDPDFNASQCQSRGFSHLMELPLPHWRQRSVDCARLATKFPFVRGSPVRPRQQVVEQLTVGGRTVREFKFVQAACSGRQ